MSKRLAIIAGALVAISLLSSQGHTQGPGYSARRPTVSPYLNLVTSDALGQLGFPGGYQTLVKPFVEGRRASNANSAAISRLESQIYGGNGGGGGGGNGGGSGQAARFMNYSHYYSGMSGS
jgi:hypothetical protein